MLDLTYHITVICQTLQRHMVLHTPAGLAPPTPTYIIQNQPAAQSAPAKKNTRQKGGTYRNLTCTDSTTYRGLKTFPTSGRPWTL